MDSFKGFDDDTLLLLAENKFNDSRPYYESIKEVLKKKATIPMRLLCSDLCDELFEIDPHMNLIPQKMVSRIRRDTRFAKNKEMYRDNMWCMFMRHKHHWHHQPCMWFEIMPGGYSIGVGTFRIEPGYLDVYRKTILENTEEFIAACESAYSLGAVVDFECFKKEKPGSELLPKSVRPFYNAKYLYFINFSSDLSPIFSHNILDEIRKNINAYTPMYKFLIKVCERIISEKGKNYDED